MKRMCLWAAALLLVWVAGGCAAPEAVVSIGEDVEAVEAAHTAMGQTVSWTAAGETLAALRTWAAGLRAVPVSFGAGGTPGDSDGGEAYTFDLPDGSGFSYVVNGPEECYLLYAGDWYAVSGPADPPAAPQLTREDVRALAQKGEALDWADFAQYPHTDIGSGLHIFLYDIDARYCLAVGGGSLLTPPLYVRLIARAEESGFLDDGAYIDIRFESVDAFLAAQGE